MATFASDPVYQQWLGNLGFLNNDATRRAEDARTSVANQADFAAEGIGIDRDRTQEAIGGNFENRMMTRSGEHLQRRAEALRDSNRAFGALQLDTANRLAGIDDNLYSQLAELQMRDMGYQFDATGRAARRAGDTYDFNERVRFLQG